MEHYQPEFVLRYLAENTDCACPACQTAEGEWPLSSLKFNHQQRDFLDVSCESAARQMLLNPQAFVLHAGENDEQPQAQPDLWLETLNQQCLNLAMHPALTVETALYAVGILLSKAQQYQKEQQNDPSLLVAMAEQISQLADAGILAEQRQQLPQMPEQQCKALKALATQRLNFNLPMLDKMTLSLKVGEIVVMNDAQIADRLAELHAHWQQIAADENVDTILRNVLIYQLYSQVFPGNDRYGAALHQLTSQFFQLKMLCALWAQTGNALNADSVLPLFSAWFQVQSTAQDVEDDEVALLQALSLI